MAGVDEIETAVGENDLARLVAPRCGDLRGGVQRDDLGLFRLDRRSLDAGDELGGFDRGGAVHGDGDAGRRVGELGRHADGRADDERQRECGEDQYPRLGHVMHLAAFRREVGDPSRAAVGFEDGIPRLPRVTTTMAPSVAVAIARAAAATPSSASQSRPAAAAASRAFGVTIVAPA